MGANVGTIECDVLVVGGGINGAAIARDAAGRGLSVVLCEKDDLGQHTSSASSKLLHGGLRYLEHWQFGLVRKALAEREVLLASAPHIARPLRFVLPHAPGLRPAWLLRAGLFLYDHLAPRQILPASQAVDLMAHRAGGALKPEYTRAFVYSDGWVDDARLVILNAMDARERGAVVMPRTLCQAPDRTARHWSATLAREDGHTLVQARCLVNAAGPWAAQFLQNGQGKQQCRLRLVKGSHIVVPRQFMHACAYVFQHPDGRAVFAQPYEEAFTLIGTTDVGYQGAPDAVAISADEIAYLCEVANRYFRRQLSPEDVVWSFSGVRPLLEDGASSATTASRDYRLVFDTGGAPLLGVLGGKLTTSRKLAEQAVDWIVSLLGTGGAAWTANACLPGGDLYGDKPSGRGVLEFDRWLKKQERSYPWLPPDLLARYGRAYGTRMERLLENCRSLEDLGKQVAPSLYAVEIDYLMTHEWATSAEDLLWRRSKLGLHVAPGLARKLDEWIRQREALAAH
ncbi:glycerol-3-phosphate dehydrogenase [Massilia horti]|uniref:Glycerol-3-phosphate dehydrogenase n=1 Tax=Massilia horti TaxID=2562153 RepID=A0A4Y9T7W6_9BURK|nr:glycerol-3-phosphate dehydrogenase [Massilia horti]TFW34842.1 glycerol-3-phosphate dehydrogenase [Massilia horti]